MPRRGASGWRERPDWRRELEDEERRLFERTRGRRVSEAPDEPRGRRILRRIVYCIGLALIVAAWAYAFRAYFRHYDSTHPELAWTAPFTMSRIEKVEGVLLWDETVLTSPIAGSVSYPMGRGPFRVQAGAVVAKVKSGSLVRDVKAPDAGYFIAGLDGCEGAWRYSDIWLAQDLPPTREAVLIDADASVSKGDAVGKIVPQPQELRFIGWIGLSEGVERALDAKRLRVKMDEMDSPSDAAIRVHDERGHRSKIYVTMPWFQPNVLKDRSFTLLVDVGTEKGVVVPSSAVTYRDGRIGVFVVRGSEAVFERVEGRTIDGGRYLATKGIALGDAVIADGEAADEGRISLW